MADWYCSSVAYAAVTAWANGVTLAVGAIRRQLATPTVGNERCFRVSAITTGITGGSEPSWVLTKAGTTTDSGVTWTECTGNSAQQQNGGVTNTWTAPHARVENAIAWMASNDRIFTSSDHTQTVAGTKTMGLTGVSAQNLSVDRTTGNIPPLPADLTAGAAIAATNSSSVLGITADGLWRGFTFTYGTSTNTGGALQIGQSGLATLYFSNCNFILGGSGGNNAIQTTGTHRIVFVACSFKFGATTDSFTIANDTEWLNSTALVAGSAVPTNGVTVNGGRLICRAVDFSGLTTALFAGNSSAIGSYTIFDCKLPSSGSILKNAITGTAFSEYNILNCDSGANYYKNSWFRYPGSIVSDATNVRTSGATDGVTPISHKYVSLSGATILTPLYGPDILFWNTTTGASKTLTIALISSASLNDNDIWAEICYLGSGSSPLGSLASSFPATFLTTASALATDAGSSWSSAPATPQQQKMVVSFTPQGVGLFAVRVKLGKASTTVWVDPFLQVV